jgi:cytochrome P450 family 135
MFRPIPFMERCRERYGRVFSMRLGSAKNVVMVADPAIAKEILTGDPSVFKAGATNGIFRPVVGSNSILLLDGDEHLRHRRILLKSFSASHAMQFAEQVRQIAERRISTWEVGQRLQLQDEMEAISFESIMRVVFGDETGEAQEGLRELIPEMMDRCDSAFTLIPWFRRDMGGVSPYARLMRVVEQVDDLLFELIDERRRDPLHQVRDDTLSLLLRAEHEDGSPLDEHEIRDQILTLIMAGYETTTSGLAWALERLLRSPERLERLTGEIEQGDDTYLEAAVRETLRVRPVIPVVARQASQPIELGDYVVPAGTTVMVSIYLIHKDPEIYEDPEEFRPERFLGGPPDGATWIPFGGGVRRCLGFRFAQLETKIVLGEILARAKLRPVGRHDEDIKRRRFTLAPERGATAIVDSLVEQEKKPGSGRFRRRDPHSLTPHG